MNDKRSTTREFLHKLRGLAQVVYDAHYLHPRAAASLYALAAVLMIGGAGWLYHSKSNQRVLRGTELNAAEWAFDQLTTADSLAEDFSEGSNARESAKVRAEVAVAKFSGEASSVQAQHLFLVMTYYLAAITKLPDMDYQCSVVKLTAHETEEAYGTQTPDKPVTQSTLVRAEVAYSSCLSARQRVQTETVACRNEALSYISPSSMAPIDTCVWRAETPLVVRK